MKNGKNNDSRPIISMAVSHRIDTPAFGRRAAHGHGTPNGPAGRALNSSTVLVAAAVAFAIPATLFGLFADESGVAAPEAPAAIGLRGSLPIAAIAPEKRSPI